MIEVLNVIRAFPEQLEGTSGVHSLTVKSHWNDSSKVVLMVEGCAVTVYVKDLQAAIENSVNVARF